MRDGAATDIIVEGVAHKIQLEEYIASLKRVKAGKPPHIAYQLNGILIVLEKLIAGSGPRIRMRRHELQIELSMRLRPTPSTLVNALLIEQAVDIVQKSLEASKARPIPPTQPRRRAKHYQNRGRRSPPQRGTPA